MRHLVGDTTSDMRVLERDMSLLLGEAQGGGFSPAVMNGVLDVMERHGLRPPREMLLLSRSLLTLEGTLKVVDPAFNLPAQATELVAREGLADIGSPRRSCGTSSSARSPRCARFPNTPRRSPASFAAAG